MLAASVSPAAHPLRTSCNIHLLSLPCLLTDLMALYSTVLLGSSPIPGERCADFRKEATVITVSQ
jgi:hypothetical protein